MSETTIAGTALRIEGVGDDEPEAELLLIYRGWPGIVAPADREAVERAYVAKYEGEDLAFTWGEHAAASWEHVTTQMKKFKHPLSEKGDFSV
jgi:hypothetical protein